MTLHTLDTFSIDYLQILDEKGNVDKSLEPDISSEDLLKLHYYMTFSRMVDSRMLNLQRQGRLGTLPAATGQEASFCAPVLAIKDTDWFVGSYRELGGRLMRGEPLLNILHFYNGFEEGSLNLKSPRTLPVSIILASQLPHAVGLAYGSRLQGEKDTVALAVFGDGSTSEGDFHEALNFAGVLNAPVIFLCQNNQFAISTPRKLQTKSATIAQKAIAYGMPGIQVDGNDPLAVYKAVDDAVKRARENKGPSLIEAVTYRMLMHTTADDPTRYRDDAQVESWKVKDPLKRFFKYLTGKQIWDEKKQIDLEKELKQTIDQTVKEFESKKEFKPDAPFDHVFGNSFYLIDQQRAQFLDQLKIESEKGD
ncbi:MAG: pyruvate dehydrogenase (acetyl-transferring) E1 component subunit alpha [Desulfobacula sp.]|nr:pyruvate dehydrogenase (acetyl-transferring) E1 component subunit alpha [Desulfobacula sp.]MBT4875769.1 pyruvate dehydrogenase (acetyl-transferring) E1 component subunit alpha [Desulfobacula sp.]MBT5973842.1 pyruvate dehydrogenase (acetyl-transferring) E1 component subunit alpha [Desulfobacula sp.]MBT6751088.1 pyruvate dehydrogenase (acetyl-transferring) E1 component subunit alpha [Desulfobacula sp.]MBT7051694.1 pyruvate dehydrogenase (acetyl-transferring) E1 component subunit alpha [Desulfo